MKVAICKSVEIDTEVNVTVDDITAALQEAVDDAAKRQSYFEGSGSRESRHLTFAVGQLVTAAHQCLKATTDTMIEAFPAKTRNAIARSLLEQVDRWDTVTSRKQLAQDAAITFDKLRDLQLPRDIGESLELFKLAIIRHRAINWEMIDHATLVSILEALLNFGQWPGLEIRGVR